MSTRVEVLFLHLTIRCGAKGRTEILFYRVNIGNSIEMFGNDLYVTGNSVEYMSGRASAQAIS